MRVVAEIPVGLGRDSVHEQGWQSWSPSTRYGLAEQPHRWIDPPQRISSYRYEHSQGSDAFWGEGLLAVDPGDGSAVTVISATSPVAEVPSIRAMPRGSVVEIACDGDVEVRTCYLVES